jgi:hypothetical protein
MSGMLAFAIVTIIALFIPAWMVPFASSMWLGFLVGQMLVWWLGEPQKARSDVQVVDSSRPGSRRLVWATATALLAGAICSHALHGNEEMNLRADAGQSAPHQAFIKYSFRWMNSKSRQAMSAICQKSFMTP